jgi:hypothetical protein
MDYGIGMFLAGLVSGAGIGWYAALLHIRAAHGDPEDLNERADVIQRPFVQGWPVCGWWQG